MNKHVLVAMSGGVDSSVAALLLKEQGFAVTGVTMCLSVSGGNTSSPRGRRPGCCGLEGIEDARRVARQLDIRHYVLNFGKDLERDVVRDFIGEYAAGRTPNPCVRCNQYLKFDRLLATAGASGVPYLATGHYARVVRRGRSCLLKKGADARKDQSYFLCQVPRSRLGRILLPLGGLTKEEVRRIAREKGLAVADKPGSQEVCFIPDNDYRAFLRSRLDASYFKPGDIVGEDGRPLGRHEGIFNFTLGQREGLGIAAPHALYVLSIDPARHRITVGPKQGVFRKGLLADEVNVLDPAAFKKRRSIKAKIRYNHPEAPVRLTRASRSGITAVFRTAQPAVTPGQFAVFYAGDTVVAGGRITGSF
ncbi:MAG: tRNA 2-thiouridine(34) synthase MnmA [Deltaproteobacteria bacterium]